MNWSNRTIQDFEGSEKWKKIIHHIQKKETATRQLSSLGYVLHNVAKNGEKCLKECNSLGRNSVQLK